jgi:hypothetical protein
MSLEPNYEEIRSRIKRRYDNRTEFLSHLVAFVISNIVLWSFLQPQFGWATLAGIITGLWFMGLVIHGIQFWNKEAQEQEIERLIERERQWRSGEISEADMKRKRDTLQLSDDGEVMQIIEDEDKPARRRR